MNDQIGSTIQNHDPTKPDTNTREKHQNKYRIHSTYQTNQCYSSATQRLNFILWSHQINGLIHEKNYS